MNKNKDIFDIIDEYFSQINGEEITNKINQGVNSFSKTIEESLKNSKYIFEDNKNIKEVKPKLNKQIKRYSSRMEVVKQAIHQVNYGLKYRGAYQDGHSQALNDIDKMLDQYTYDLDDLNNQIELQIKEIKIQYQDYKKAYITGYIDGLEYVQKAIIKSKTLMMERIINEIK